jgi:hypothetical protein
MKPGKPLSRKTPLRPVSAKRRAAKASPEGKAGKAHMALVAQLSCVICDTRPVHVHHVIHKRYSTRRAPDTDTIPLCRACHDELHAGKETWAAKHGPDYGFLPAVRRSVADLRNE